MDKRGIGTDQTDQGTILKPAVYHSGEHTRPVMSLSGKRPQTEAERELIGLQARTRDNGSCICVSRVFDRPLAGIML